MIFFQSCASARKVTINAYIIIIIGGLITTVIGPNNNNSNNNNNNIYSDLDACCTFVPVAFVTLVPMNAEGLDFVQDIGRRLAAISGDTRETEFLSQRLSIALQRFNAICFKGTFRTNNLELLHDIIVIIIIIIFIFFIAHGE